MKLRNCACYPIHLNFETPLSEAEVREQIAQWVKRGDRDWREFRHFDVCRRRAESRISGPIPHSFAAWREDFHRYSKMTPIIRSERLDLIPIPSLTINGTRGAVAK